MIIDIILTLLMFVLFGASAVLIPWALFLMARVMIRRAHRNALLA